MNIMVNTTVHHNLMRSKALWCTIFWNHMNIALNTLTVSIARKYHPNRLIVVAKEGLLKWLIASHSAHQKYKNHITKRLIIICTNHVLKTAVTIEL